MKTRPLIIVAGLIGLGVVGYLMVPASFSLRELAQPDRVRALVSDLGVFGPIGLIGLRGS